MKHCGFFWKSAATVISRNVVLSVEKIADHVAAHEEFDLAGDQQHAAVRRRAARHDGDVEAVFLVSAVDQRLVVAARFRVGEPVGGERHLVEREGRLCQSRRARQRGDDPSAHSVSSKLPIRRRRNACDASPSAGRNAPLRGSRRHHKRAYRKRRIQIHAIVNPHKRIWRCAAIAANRDAARALPRQTEFSPCASGSRTRSPSSRRTPSAGSSSRDAKSSNASRAARRRSNRGARPSTPRAMSSLPGLINAHHHFYQTLTRAHPSGFGKDLLAWLVAMERVWDRMTPEALRVAVRMALVELLLSGCTTAADHHNLFPPGLETGDRHRGRGGDEARAAHDGHARLDGHF